MFRPIPHGTNQLKYFLDNDRIAVGYPLGENLENARTSHISNLLAAKDWSEGFGNLVDVVKPDIIKVNDLLVVPDDKKDIYMCQVMSNYVDEPDLDVDEKGTGFPHQRSVKCFFNKEPLVRSELPEQLRASIESFHSSLKSETFYLDELTYTTTTIVEQTVKNYITYYNNARIQKHLLTSHQYNIDSWLFKRCFDSYLVVLSA